MIRSFSKLKNHIVKDVSDEKAEIPVYKTWMFAAKTVQYQSMLNEIDFVTKSIETYGITLA